LIKQMSLTPEESDKFKEMLSDTAMKGAEKASSLFGAAAGTNRTQTQNAMVAENQSHEEQLKQLLGETRYTQYKAYQETAAERMQLNLFKQTGGSDMQLNDQQTEQLLGLMKEEKLKLAAAGQPMLGMSNDPGNLQTIMTEGGTEMLLQNQESMNQRVFERARDLLAPEQLNAFERFQSNQLQTMRMGLSMARKFMTPDKAP